MNRLTDVDRKKIIDYIALNNECRSRDIKLNDVLAEWDEAKEFYLDELFGNELILSKDIIVEKTTDMIEEEFSRDREFERLLYDFRDALYKYEVTSNFNDVNNNKPEIWAHLHQVAYYYTLAKNECPLSFNFNIPGTDKTIKVQEGMKPMKVLAKIAEAIDEKELFEKLRIKHSQFHNQKKVAGTLCLSIHPLDYMTMSDNASNWTSCMGWSHTGCYRAGTIEMMNSRTVIVAYLKSKEDMTHLPDRAAEFVWNNKKWRTLIVVDPDNVITTVKSYPYVNENLDKAVMDWVCELVAAHGYPRYSNLEGKYYECGDSVFDYLGFKSGIMYNDFGRTKHYMVFEEYPKSYKNIHYSGYRTCILCGRYVSEDNDGEELCCHHPDCGLDTFCELCEDHVDDVEEVYVKGRGMVKVCSHCRKYRLNKDFFTNEYVYVGDLNMIYLTDRDDNTDVWDFHYYVSILKEDYPKIEEFFNSKIMGVATYWSTQRVINISNMPEENKKHLLDFFSNKNYYTAPKWVKSKKFEDFLEDCVYAKHKIVDVATQPKYSYFDLWDTYSSPNWIGADKIVKIEDAIEELSNTWDVDLPF